jgi:hypothetical protein
MRTPSKATKKKKLNNKIKTYGLVLIRHFPDYPVELCFKTQRRHKEPSFFTLRVVLNLKTMESK